MAESEMVKRVAEALERALADFPEIGASRFPGLARAAIEAMRGEIENIYTAAESSYAGDWGSIFEEFTVRTRESFDAALWGPAVEIDMSDAVPSPAGEGR